MTREEGSQKLLSAGWVCFNSGSKFSDFHCPQEMFALHFGMDGWSVHQFELSGGGGLGKQIFPKGDMDGTEFEKCLDWIREKVKFLFGIIPGDPQNCDFKIIRTAEEHDDHQYECRRCGFRVWGNWQTPSFVCKKKVGEK